MICRGRVVDKGRIGFRRYRGGEGDDLISVDEDNGAFSGLNTGGFAMSFTLKFCLLQRSFLTRLLQTTGLSLALMTASAAGVHAESVTVQGMDGANGADGVNPDDEDGQRGFDGKSAVANASSGSPNSATAIGGDGGNGGNIAPPTVNGRGFPGDGGTGGAAMATAATTIASGSAAASATANGGNGGIPGSGNDGNGGFGGPATAHATGSSGNGSATASASATGGNGGFSVDEGGGGGDASATSTAIANGSGDALSSANATGGAQAARPGPDPGNATAGADASAHGGKAIATAVATSGVEPLSFLSFATAYATSKAETTNGAMAKALSTVSGTTFAGIQATSTAKTSFAGVSVQSTTTTASSLTTEAIAQGGSGQTFVDQGETAAAIATALPDKAFATTLIGAGSNVADALLGPGDEIFGTAILEGSSASATFDFSFRGDLILGVIDGEADITVNGTELSVADGFAEDTVFDLGSFGPNIELTITDGPGTFDGSGTFVIGGAVPEPSTWAMMLLGFAGLGFMGWRGSRKTTEQPA
jgi:PEP-CTERM motif